MSFDCQKKLPNLIPLKIQFGYFSGQFCRTEDSQKGDYCLDRWRQIYQCLYYTLLPEECTHAAALHTHPKKYICKYKKLSRKKSLNFISMIYNLVIFSAQKWFLLILLFSNKTIQWWKMPNWITGNRTKCLNLTFQTLHQIWLLRL